MVHKSRQSISYVGGVCVPNNLAVDSAGDAVLQLEVHLGDGIVGEDGGVRDITYTVKIVESAPVAVEIVSHQFVRAVVLFFHISFSDPIFRFQLFRTTVRGEYGV